MAISNEAYDLIQKYLSGEPLTSDEQSTFDQYAMESRDFNDELMVQRGMIAMLKAKQKAVKMEEMRALSREIDASHLALKPVWYRNKFWAAAAVFVLLATCSLYLVSRMSQPVPAYELFRQHYEPLPLMSVTRSADSLEQQSKWRVAYHHGDYLTTIEFLEALRNQTLEQKQAMSLIYLGIAYLESDKYSIAESVFHEVMQFNQDEFIKQHAHWYLAMLALKTDNVLMAKDRLSEIAGERGIYDSTAKALLTKLQ